MKSICILFVAMISFRTDIVNILLFDVNRVPDVLVLLLGASDCQVFVGQLLAEKYRMQLTPATVTIILRAAPFCQGGIPKFYRKCFISIPKKCFGTVQIVFQTKAKHYCSILFWRKK